MTRLAFSLFMLTSLGCFTAAEAGASAAPSSEVRALFREVELQSQATQNLKTEQELLEERLRALEHKIDQLQKELAQATRTQGRPDQTRSGENSSSLPAAWNQWRQQTDQNISHLQQSLQALAKAMAGSSESSSEVYVVKSGDSLEKIAKKHQSTVQALMDLNGLKSSKIGVGQKLKIPAQ